MDLEKALQFVETYARGYLSYLLAFFGEPTSESTNSDATDPFKTTVIFAVLSAFLGAVFSANAVSGAFPHQDDLLAHISEEFAYWFALAVVLYLILRGMGLRKIGLESLLVVLNVTPVAYAVSGYGSYIVSIVGQLWLDGSPLRWTAYFAAVVMQILVCLIYFPIYIGRVARAGWLRTLMASAILIVLIVLVQFFHFVGAKVRIDKAAAAAAAPAASKPAVQTKGSPS